MVDVFVGSKKYYAMRNRGLEALNSIGRDRAIQELGITRRTWYSWQSDNGHSPRLMQFTKMCEVSGYSPSWICFGVGRKFLDDIPEANAVDTLETKLLNANIYADALLEKLKEES